MLRMRRRGWRAGVTLIEVTVVAGILSNLASQQNGVFMQVQNKGLGDACLMQLKQIYLQIQMYAEDNDGRLPTAWFFPFKQDPTDQYNLVNVLARNNASMRQLFICPAAPQPWKQLGITYAYNDRLSGCLLDNVPNPTNTWLMMDANVINPERFPPPHVGGYNVLFCDGHSKWIQASQMPLIWRPPVQAQAQPPTPPPPKDDAAD
jgi:prepilin-type processing-associated H-X9-DG protein